MIQHDLATGRTCFFQSRIMADLDGRTVPSPSDRTEHGSQHWLQNERGGPGGITCTGCHAADPFIRSPFVTQKADIGRWNGLGRYDSNFADLFGDYARIFQPAQPSDASCTECRRFGRGPKTDAGCSVYTRRYTGQPEFSTNPHEVLMPRTGAWHSGYDTALAQIQRCCANPDLAECQSRLADGAPPP